MLQATLSEPLEEGRAKWVLEKGGKRFKLQTIDDNEVIVVIYFRSLALIKMITIMMMIRR
jgi:hypothetical protein